MQASKLLNELGTHAKMGDVITSGFSFLPDPDPILRKMGQGVEVLDSILSDPEVLAAVETRQAGTLLQMSGWHAGTRDGEAPSRDAIEARDALAAKLTPENMYDWISEMLDAPLYGTIPVEIIYARKGGRILIERLSPKPAEYIRYTDENEPRLASRRAPWGTEIPDGKFIYVRNRPRWKNPYGRRILSSLLWPVTFKRGGLKFWADFMDRYGIPLALGTVDQDTYEKKSGEIVQNLEAMVRNAVGVVTAGTDVKIVEASTVRGDLYEKFYDTMNATISKAILGETLTTEQGDRGSQALGTVHERIEERRELSDERMIEFAMNRVGRYFVRFNSPNTPAPVYRYQRQEVLHQPRVERDRILHSMGVRFKDDYFADHYGIPKKYFEVDSASAFQMPDHTSPHQREIDTLIEERIRETARVTDDEVEKIMSVAKRAKSFSDLEDELLSALSDADAHTFADAMQAALIASDIYGHVAMHEGGK